MRITAQSLNEFGLVDEVLAEPLGGAHRNPQQMAAEIIRNAVLKAISEELESAVLSISCSKTASDDSPVSVKFKEG